MGWLYIELVPEMVGLIHTRYPHDDCTISRLLFRFLCLLSGVHRFVPSAAPVLFRTSINLFDYLHHTRH